MVFDPVATAATVVLKLFAGGKVRGAIRLIISVIISAFVSFWGVFGMSLWALQGYGPVWCVILSIGNSSIAMAVSVVWVMRRSRDAKDLMLAIPGDLEREVDRVLREQNMVVSGGRHEDS